MPSSLPRLLSTRASRGSFVVIGLFCAAACGGGTYESGDDDGLSDGGDDTPLPSSDAGRADAGRSDGGPRDAAAADASPADAGEDAAIDDAGDCAGAADGAPCGDQASTTCNGADTCRQGVCQSNVATDGTECGDPTSTTCDAADSCVAGVCAPNVAADGTACGDATTGACTAPDTCAAGSCAPNHAEPGAACGDADQSQCNGADTCDENGACQTHVTVDGVACYDCAQGGGLCATCTTGACTNAPACTAVAEASLPTEIVNNNGQDGNMFDVTATNTVIITGFEGNIANTPNAITEYHVFYKAGTHVGFENDAAAWTELAGPLAFAPNAPNALTPITSGLSVRIPAGETYAFYLTNTSAIGNNNRYHNGSATGATLATDANLTIKEGTGGAYPFGTFFNARPWEGRILYRPALATTALGAVPSDGVMFDLLANDALSLQQLDVHLGAGTHDLSVYFRRGTHVGAETTPAVWHLLGSGAGVVTAAADAFTTVPFATSAQLAAGETGAFYVTTGPASNAVLSSAGTAVGAASVITPQATLREGVAVSGAFGAVGDASKPEVAFDYDRCAP